ncbi:ABC transporter permease [Aureimonas pseudogalii]|uniref:Putative ABC transport system permease protein n=1 Tax=Aureimonas pseudogalii TaxID=1744844 RepID=A0A7W6EHN3_9HYPH|nr:ABC transporter permease [Aureimonas pseudogalii]MBB3998384.1 putative ABC transport system permease protein [Aureimonas pseudogalii]
MSSLPRQMLVLTRASLASLPRRTAISLSMVLSVALVVAVLIGFLFMAAGLRQTLGTGGSPDVAIVLGGGTQEVGSSIPPEAARSLAAAGTSGGIADDPAGHLLLSREILVPVEATGVDGTSRMIALRGMETAGPALRASASIGEGRVFAPESREIVVGARLARDLGGLVPGKTIRLGPVDWTVAGILSADGGMAESEIWADLDAVRSAFDRLGEIQTLRARLAGPDGLATLQASLPTISTTPLTVVSEAEFLAGQSARTERLVTLFGWPIALLMAVGATAGALNTMMSSVSDRSVEIATLRVLGFSRVAAFTATFTEAALLSLAGGLLGAVASWGILDGWQASTLGANDTQLAFRLSVTPLAMLQAGTLALLVGCLGGALPAFAATRLPLVSALRGNG